MIWSKQTSKRNTVLTRALTSINFNLTDIQHCSSQWDYSVKNYPLSRAWKHWHVLVASRFTPSKTSYQCCCDLFRNGATNPPLKIIDPTNKVASSLDSETEIGMVWSSLSTRRPPLKALYFPIRFHKKLRIATILKNQAASLLFWKAINPLQWCFLYLNNPSLYLQAPAEQSRLSLLRHHPNTMANHSSRKTRGRPKGSKYKAKKIDRKTPFGRQSEGKEGRGQLYTPSEDLKLAKEWINQSSKGTSRTESNFCQGAAYICRELYGMENTRGYLSGKWNSIDRDSQHHLATRAEVKSQHTSGATDGYITPVTMEVFRKRAGTKGQNGIFQYAQPFQ